VPCRSFTYLFQPGSLLSWFTHFWQDFLAQKQKYPEAQKKEALENDRIDRYHEWKKSQEKEIIPDNSFFTKALRGLSIMVLAVTTVLGLIVLLGSSDESRYLSNRDTFYRFGFICTITYFVTAYWAMRRRKNTTQIK
jgi:hypothetical protein